MAVHLVAVFLLLLSDTALAGKPRDIEEAAAPTPPRLLTPPLAHISEFTDPDTGLNPFLDIEEGREEGRAFAGDAAPDVEAALPHPPHLSPREGDAARRPGDVSSWWIEERGSSDDSSTTTTTAPVVDSRAESAPSEGRRSGEDISETPRVAASATLVGALLVGAILLMMGQR